MKDTGNDQAKPRFPRQAGKPKPQKLPHRIAAAASTPKTKERIGLVDTFSNAVGGIANGGAMTRQDTKLGQMVEVH